MKALTKILNLAGKHKKPLLTSAIVDILFFILLIVVFYFFFMRMMPGMVAITNIAESELGSAIQSLTVEDPAAINELLPKLRSHYIFLMTNMLLMFLSFLVLCLATQTFSWYKVHTLYRKIKFVTYAKSFAIISTAYFLIFLISAPIFFNLLYFLSRALGTPIRPAFLPIMSVIFLLISYLAITTYSLIGNKSIIKNAFKKAASKYILKFLTSIVIIFIIAFILSKIINFITSPIIQFLILLLVFPFITIAKLWLLE